MWQVLTWLLDFGSKRKVKGSSGLGSRGQPRGQTATFCSEGAALGEVCRAPHQSVPPGHPLPPGLHIVSACEGLSCDAGFQPPCPAPAT